MLAGQMQQGVNVWEMLSFELVAKVAFDNLVQLVDGDRRHSNATFSMPAMLPLSKSLEIDADTSAEIEALGTTAFAA